MSGQLITVRMNRGDASSPWGFRLQGGKDWGTPLAVSKINPGSLAEQGGLQVGDFIIKIGSSSGQEMLHHEAQEAIKSAKNNLDLQIQRGGTLTWRPTVTAVGDLPKPGTINSTPNSTQSATFTKTSLAKTGPEPRPIGTGHNSAAKPFGGVGIGGGGNSRLPALVHKQFNSPLNLYSESNIKETLQAHTEQLAPGVMGINFMKPDAPVNKHSAVYQAILEEEQSKQKVQSGTIGSPTPLSPSNSPRLGIGSFTKHVEAPISRGLNSSTSDPSSQSSINTCGQCGGLITGVFCRIRDKSLHAECFKCATCGTSLKNVGYFNVNDKLYCDAHAGQAAQHLANSTGQSNLEPVTVRPGAAIPKDANIIGIGGGGIPQNVSPTPGKISSPRITIPSPTQPSSIIDRPTSPSVLGAVPWHQQSPGSIHHVEAPQSPRLLQTTTPMMNQVNSVPAPPVAPKPQYKPMGSQSPNLYQSHPHPYSAPSQDVHKDVSGGSKFTWPPPKPVTPVGTPEVPPTSMSNQLPGPMMTPSMVPQQATGPPTFRPVPPPGSQRPLSSYEPVKISTPNATSNVNLPSGTTSNSTSAPIGQSSIPGSRPAPRRGRGQLKPQVGPGIRIPICSSCGSPIRGPFIVALGKTWCPEHFQCANASCHRTLEDIGFVEERGELYCEVCFESYLAPICAKCGIRIKKDCLMALEKQ